jgi:aminomethyltransferase
MTETTHQSPLHGTFQALEANFGTEADWSVPLSFTGPLDEAQAALDRAVVFDLTPLGRLRIRGDGAVDLLERVCTHDVAGQEDDTTAHTLLLTERGTILEEALLTRLENFWVLTTNPGNREKVLRHLQVQELEDARVDDQTFKVAQLGVVGPAGEDILNAVLPISIKGLSRGSARQGSIMVANYIASRTAETSAWSLEVMLPNLLLKQAWSFITEKAGQNALTPAGWVARDVLRQHAGLCRYGCEVSEAVDPLTAGLEACLGGEQECIGRSAIDDLRRKGPARRRVQLRLPAPVADQPAGPSLPRQGDALTDTDGREVGNVTSAAPTPDAQAVLAQAYLAADAAGIGRSFTVHARLGPLQAEVVGVFGRL